MQIKQGSLTAISDALGLESRIWCRVRPVRYGNFSREGSFGVELAYRSHISWIQNATLVREFNIVF